MGADRHLQKGCQLLVPRHRERGAREREREEGKGSVEWAHGRRLGDRHVEGRNEEERDLLVDPAEEL
jgi:hypothetical protein